MTLNAVVCLDCVIFECYFCTTLSFFLFVCFGCEVSSFEYFSVNSIWKASGHCFWRTNSYCGCMSDILWHLSCVCLHWPFRFKELWRLWHHWFLMWYLLHYGFSLCCTVGCSLYKPIITYMIMLLSCRILFYLWVGYKSGLIINALEESMTQQIMYMEFSELVQEISWSCIGV